MSEGKKIRIVLLHDKHLDMLVQPKLFASELMEMTASHLMLRDKEYFGLSYKEDAGHYQWLTLDRRVLDHDLPKNQKPILLYFQVRLYVESICQLKDPVTIELFYLNARQSIAQERLKCDSATVFDLAAYVLQEAHSDYADDATTRNELKALPLLPVGTLKEHPSISFCEEQVIQRYKKLTGMSRGFAVVNYMKIVENLPSYGIHFYEVKDKSGLPWWLGLSVKGLTIYDFNDRFTPRKEFHWKRLLNLYYRDRKFSIQVHDSKSEGDVGCGGVGGKAVSAIGSCKSRRLLGPNQVATNVQSWFSASSQLTKCIWSMAVCQHQKYIELRTTKSANKTATSTIRSLVEVASDLTNSCLNQTPNASDCSSLSAASHSSASNSKLELNVESSELYKTAMQEMYSALKERKEALESQLMKKTKLLCQLCLQEAELTGFLPPETPVSTGGQLPKFQRRIGTSFTLSPKVLERDYHNSKKDGQKSDLDDFDQLEVDLEIQDKIAQAALMLAKDKSVRRSVRKKRALSYQRASQKLKEMEVKLLEHQLQSAARKNSLAAESNISDGHLSEDSRDILDSENELNSAFSSPLISRHELDIDRLNLAVTSRAAEVLDDKADEERTKGLNWSTSKVTQSSSEQSLLPSRSHVTETALSSPCSPVVDAGHRQTKSNDVSPSPAPSPMVARQRLGGYVASSIYSTRTQYRNQRYPTLCGTYTTSHLLDEEGEVTSSNSNLYNVWLPKSPYYDSGDELKTPSPAARRPTGFFVTPTEAMKREVGASGSLMKTSHSSSDMLDCPQAKQPDICVSSRCGMSPATTERKLFMQHCALLPSSDVVRGTCALLPSSDIRSACALPSSDIIRGSCALPPGDIIRGSCALPPSDIIRGTCALPPGDIIRGSCALPPSDIIRGTCAVPPSDIIRSTCALPPSDVIRSTCHVVTSVNRSCYGNGSAHVMQNVRTETSRVYEATSPSSTVTMTNQSMSSSTEGHLPPDPDAVGCETTVQKYHNYIEISKPFEMSDFYKYSERLRRQRLVGQVVSLGSSSQSPEGTASIANH